MKIADDEKGDFLELLPLGFIMKARIGGYMSGRGAFGECQYGGSKHAEMARFELA